MRVAVGLVLCLLFAGLSPVAAASSDADDAWPGEPVDNHVHMTWAALTMEVNDWADNHPDIVKLIDAGDSELGKTLWVLQISDWSMETKANGKAKEIVYIDGGHHGNEYLGTALAWLSAQFYIEGWSEGNQEVIDVLQSTELHILIMLNPDGNDFDTRWNINQVDLNRNYDHYWNTCPTTQPGSSAFSEAETAANAEYMNTYVTDADLYVTMHTGVWDHSLPLGQVGRPAVRLGIVPQASRRCQCQHFRYTYAKRQPGIVSELWHQQGLWIRRDGNPNLHLRNRR